jgi:hypothetical protein
MMAFFRLTQSSGIASIMAMIIAMLLTNPASKLCIAPGSHIAIEEMDFECSASSNSPVPAMPHLPNYTGENGVSRSCTDIIIAAFAREASPSPQDVTIIPLGERPAKFLPTDSSTSTLRQGIVGDKPPNPAHPSAPLRC